MPRLKRFLAEVKDGVVPQTIWLHSEVGHTQEASQQLKQLFPDVTGVAFPTPKTVRLMKRCIQIGCDPDGDDTVLDFFAGSCTTAQAILEMNRDDGHRRRFIMVQLPEPITEPHSLADGSRLSTIADIGRERISRVIRTNTVATSADEGFRFFRLAESCYRPADVVGAADSSGDTQLFIDPLRSGWTVEQLLYEIAIREGFDLAVHIEQVPQASTNTVFRLSDPFKQQWCFACLDDSLAPETPRELGLKRDQLFICLDSALDDDLAANLALQCRLKVI